MFLLVAIGDFIDSISTMWPFIIAYIFLGFLAYYLTRRLDTEIDKKWKAQKGNLQMKYDNKLKAWLSGNMKTPAPKTPSRDDIKINISV